MRQALIYKGKVKTMEIPAPVVSNGRVLIRVVNSCISAGTEMANIASAEKPIAKTLLEQPEKIRKILRLIRSEGLEKVRDQYRSIKDAAQATGYSVSGIVIGMGRDVEGFSVGDHVAAGGGGYAYHAEFVEVPVNLVVKMPVELAFGPASTVAVGAIALHGVRRASPGIGEVCVVIGTGILGLIALQILVSSGVQVIAVDVNRQRLEIARALGATQGFNPAVEDPVAAVAHFTDGQGADAVLFAASTSDSKPLSQAFQMCRRKGKVVLMGVSGMEINRKDIYPGEIDLLVSTSYGPGRYDKTYEEGGMDYPYAYVRWTEGRNFSAYLRLLETGQINLDPLISRVYPIEASSEAFAALKSKEDNPVLVLLDYGIPDGITELPVERKLVLKTPPDQKTQPGLKSAPDQKTQPDLKSAPDLKIPPDLKTTPDLKTPPTLKKDIVRVGIIGVGNFTQSMHLPNLKKLEGKFSIQALASHSGVKVRNAGSFYNVSYVTTDYNEVIQDGDIDLVMICTRHGNHASLVLQSLEAGKHVFVEKPLATNYEDLQAIEDYFKQHEAGSPLLMVGYNRRFSPYTREIKKFTDDRMGPLFIHYRMNAGYHPADHWTQADGGRIIGEACHIIDIASALTNCRVKDCQSRHIVPSGGKFSPSDNKSILLEYEDGSLVTIEYTSMGNTSLEKEYMEIHFDNKSIVMHDYKRLESHGAALRHISSRKSLKGHLEELEVLYDSIAGKSQQWPIDLDSLIETTAVSFRVA